MSNHPECVKEPVGMAVVRTKCYSTDRNQGEYACFKLCSLNYAEVGAGFLSFKASCCGCEYTPPLPF